MNIKTYLPVAGGIALLSMFASCDNIDSEDRYESIEKPVTPPHSVPKTLLIQEFTGNMCTNCPQGAAQIHSIQEEFPGQVIAVGMHPAGGGPNTEPIGTQDFRCDEAQVMFEFFRPSGFPCAVFNGESKSTRIAFWYSIASEMMAQEANMTIEATSDYDASSRLVTVNYQVTPTADLDGEKNIIVWVMENHIIGYQLDNGTMLDNYEHNHVLRASLNGDWGQSLPFPLTNGNVIEGTASMTLSSEWVAENCQLVVFVIDNQSKNVEQSFLLDVTDNN